MVVQVSDGLHANDGLSLRNVKSTGYCSRLVSWITASPLELGGPGGRSRLHFSAVWGCVKVAGCAEGHCLVLGLINSAQTFGGGQTLLG